MRKNTTILAFLAVLCAGGPALALTLSAGDAGEVLPGNYLDIPIDVSQTDGLDIMAFEFHFCYDPASFSFHDLVVNEDFLPDPEYWEVDYTLLSPGDVLIIGFGRDVPLSGAGTLVNVTLYLQEDVEWGTTYTYGFDCCPPFFGEDVDVITDGGEVTVPVRPAVNVTGTVFTKVMECNNCTWECEELGVPGVEVFLYDRSCEPCDPPEAYAMTTTDADGEFIISVFDDGEYRLEIEPVCYAGPDLSGQIDDATINMEDLYFLRRHLLQMQTLTNCPVMPGMFGECPPTVIYPQMIAADVSFDEHVTVADAPYLWQLISNVAASGYTTLPSDPWCWTTFCETREMTITVPPEGGPDVTEDFFIVLPGDVDGSFALETPLTAARDQTILRAPTLHGVEQQTRGAITLENADSFHSAQFVLNYDPSIVRIQDLQLGADLPDGTLYQEAVAPGTYFIGVLNLNYDVSLPEIQLVTFEAILLSDDPAATSPLTFSSYRTNLGVPSAVTGMITRQPLANDDRTWGEVKSLYR